MCEFKVKEKSDGTQLAEEVVVLSYSDDHRLLLKDILGTSTEAGSALIYDVDTLETTCTLIQHPLVKPFIDLLENLTQNKAKISDIESFQEQLEEIKGKLE